MPAPEGGDLGLLISAARAAGRIALAHFDGPREAVEKPGGQGPVTAADLEVDAYLRAVLTEARPDYGWLSEETPDGPERLDAERVFVVDPIDGTRAFIDGHRSWAHSLAVVVRGEVRVGVVYLPGMEKLYTAEAGRGAALDGEPITVDEAADETGEILAARPNFDSRHWPGGITPMARAFRSSLANRLALVAEGRFAAMLSVRDVWEWDVAAGALIVAEAGGLVTARDGGSLRFNSHGAKQAGILAAPPRRHATLAARMGAEGGA